MKPNIRFNGFSDEWVEKKLGEIANLYQPKTISSKELINKGVPVFGANGYIGYYSKANHLLDQVTISARGANTGHPSYVKGPVWITGNSMVVNIDDIPINKYFLYTLFLKYGFKKYVTGGAQPQLIRDVLLHVPIQLPTLPEQQKIGALFSKYDTIIGMREQKLAELNALKKGLLQQMFPKTGAKVPELRFEGFADEWVEKKLGQYTELITKGTTPKDKTGIGDVNFVKVENIINGEIYPTNKIKQHEHDNYLKRSQLEEKDILFSIAGTLGRTAIVNKSILPANTNQALAIIRGYDFDTDFLITSLTGNVVKEYIRRNPTVGAQPNLSLKQVGNLLVNTPNAEEQQKIGQLFKHLDTSILNEQTKIAQLKAQKQGLLQRML